MNPEEEKALGFYEGEQPENDEEKCPVVFVIDRSISMGCTINDQIPIDELNDGLQLFENEILENEVATSRVDVAIVSFGSNVKVERDFDLIEKNTMPTIKISGSTRADLGLNKGLELIRERKDWYDSTGQTCYRPYLIYITDGGADHPNKMDPIADKLVELGEAKALNFWPIAVQGANMALLEKLAIPQFKGSKPPRNLKGLEFGKLFELLSRSFSAKANSQEGEEVKVALTEENNPFQFSV